jgi:large subunit ribosomal protein L44e
MKLPKKTKRYCPYCKKHTEQKIDVLSTGIKRGTMAYGSLSRARKRGKARGYGNWGRYSKPAISKWKRKTKATKRLVVTYKCSVCKKSKPASYGRRVSKIQMEEKQAK